jgi:pimeloyl-ACP methyl ester carboxylesterase
MDHLVRLVAVALLAVSTSAARSTAPLSVRGKIQTLQIYGQRGSPPVVVLSGDGGWIHLGPQVAETLASGGFFVVGFDSRAYLSAFTVGTSTLTVDDVPGDVMTLVGFAASGASERPILIGISEGAGLATLAATDDRVKRRVAGVIGLGLPDVNELAWRWRDSVIYVTKGVPNEPTFRVSAIVDKVAPVPLAAIHSTRDEFVPLSQVQQLMEAAREPKKLWVIEAVDHRFSGNKAEFDQRLTEAIAWVRASQNRSR